MSPKLQLNYLAEARAGLNKALEDGGLTEREQKMAEAVLEKL
ncbi:MAG: hypothetical protein SWH61_12250 [Thermodesulfobacteriota bacterium]|nr:hypothetical protein [Thermodesulfobacteriota bacterium]